MNFSRKWRTYSRHSASFLLSLVYVDGTDAGGLPSPSFVSAPTRRAFVDWRPSLVNVTAMAAMGPEESRPADARCARCAAAAQRCPDNDKDTM